MWNIKDIFYSRLYCRFHERMDKFTLPPLDYCLADIKYFTKGENECINKRETDLCLIDQLSYVFWKLLLIIRFFIYMNMVLFVIKL